MLTKTDIARIYDTILSIPGMNEIVKIDLRISRKNVLLLSHLIDHGLSTVGKEETASLLSSVSTECLNELKTISDDCLEKSGLQDLSERLNSFKSPE